jgi:murein L,D-transpeptidase YcbB/YkuD
MIESVVFSPYWNIHDSIATKEMLPKIMKDPDYLMRQNIEVVKVSKAATQVINPSKINWNEAPGDFQYQLRQKPGGHNSLGLVKFLFPNEFNVYLHSTPAREAFSRTRRDFSHGCIRVEKPAELAAWALRNNSGWTLERVQSSMERGSDSVTVTLARSIPVFIDYAAALAYENDEVHFYEDVYGHDARLAGALAKAYPYP